MLRNTNIYAAELVCNRSEAGLAIWSSLTGVIVGRKLQSNIKDMTQPWWLMRDRESEGRIAQGQNADSKCLRDESWQNAIF